MPPVDVATHLIDHLFQVGPSMGGEVLSFQEIQSWMDITGHHLDGWETETLRRLSGAYLAEYMAGSDPKRPAPYVAPVAPPTRAEVARKILSVFDLFERQDRGGR